MTIKPITLPGEAEALARVVETCRLYGFGNVMSHVSRAWRAWLGEQGMPLGSEHTVGPCQATLEKRGFRDTMELLEAYDELLTGVADRGPAAS